jgi:hypothetical protein
MRFNIENFSIQKIHSFLEFEKEQNKIFRGELVLYDINGCHKYLTLSELFEWYIKKV